MEAAELKNRALTAAALAKRDGFENTYLALIDIVRTLEKAEADPTSYIEFLLNRPPAYRS